MSLWGTLRSIGEVFGWKRAAEPVGCNLGKVIYRETKRSAQIANFHRPRRQLRPGTRALMRELFPELDVNAIRVRTRCRLPSNRFSQTGSIYGMTFGYTIYWRDNLDEDDPTDLVKLVHEVMHVDQVRRYGSEDDFACEYGKGYLAGGGDVPGHIRNPTAYHRNPLEAEAYAFDARFRDERGRVVPDRLPTP
ncbi:MAG: hypothetical protein QNJ12_00275 [Ilumatobacter sp.]|uniref:hypothetical protein n=1 Tax=Ilumatobacter sp. TaxID=1967498 RepID=UPI0026032BF3|nr:hypothetical protein [Ilumatobacter sp.]MDJ0767186.1 hypothetical protein [Ilumatobacter sp.]